MNSLRVRMKPTKDVCMHPLHCMWMYVIVLCERLWSYSMNINGSYFTIAYHSRKTSVAQLITFLISSHLWSGNDFNFYDILLLRHFGIYHSPWFQGSDAILYPPSVCHDTDRMTSLPVYCAPVIQTCDNDTNTMSVIHYECLSCMWLSVCLSHCQLTDYVSEIKT